MSEESFIGGATARVGQLIFLFITPAILFAVGFSLLKNWNANDALFLGVFIGLLSGVIRYSFIFDEVYTKNNELIAQKLFSKRIIDFKEIVSAERSSIPLTIKIVAGKQKIRFFMSLSDIKKQLFSGDSNIVVKDLEKRFGIDFIKDKTTSNS
jgi:hypothetical protein